MDHRPQTINAKMQLLPFQLLISFSVLQVMHQREIHETSQHLSVNGCSASTSSHERSPNHGLVASVDPIDEQSSVAHHVFRTSRSGDVLMHIGRSNSGGGVLTEALRGEDNTEAESLEELQDPPRRLRNRQIRRR